MSERGFTLAELLVAMAVLGMILAGIFALQQQGQVAYTWGAGRVEAQQNARLALELMTSETRSAQSVTTVTNCNNASIGTNDITFKNQNGDTIRYDVNGTYLERHVNSSAGGTNDYVIGGVVSLSIWCYDASGTTLTATAANVRSIKIKLTTTTEATVAASSPAAQRAVVESWVRLRNLL